MRQIGQLVISVVVVLVLVFLLTHVSRGLPGGHLRGQGRESDHSEHNGQIASLRREVMSSLEILRHQLDLLTNSSVRSARQTQPATTGEYPGRGSYNLYLDLTIITTSVSTLTLNSNPNLTL